jgi:hypothetical protein
MDKGLCNIEYHNFWIIDKWDVVLKTLYDGNPFGDIVCRTLHLGRRWTRKLKDLPSYAGVT